MAIRYDSQLKAEIRRTVKAFNAKIRRLENKGVSAALLPDSISSKEIQQGIRSRSDLRKRLKELQEFSSAGIATESEGGLIGTDILFQYRQGEANRAIAEIKKEYEKVAEENLKQTIKASSFSLNEKIVFYKKKWLKEHIAIMSLWGICIIGMFIAGVILTKPLLVSGSMILLVLGHAWRNNTMMTYVEQNAFDGSGRQ